MVPVMSSTTSGKRLTRHLLALLQTELALPPGTLALLSAAASESKAGRGAGCLRTAPLMQGELAPTRCLCQSLGLPLISCSGDPSSCSRGELHLGKGGGSLPRDTARVVL